MAERKPVDVGDEGEQALHPETNAQILKELKAMDQDYKGIATKLNQEVAELRKDLKSHADGDGITEEKRAKLLEAISLRQEKLDTMNAEYKSRIDQLDLALQRGERGGDSKEGDADERKMALALARDIAVIKGKNIPEEQLKVDLDFYREYRKAFNAFIRTSVNNVNGLSPEHQKLLMSGSEADGGITCPPTMAARITQRVWELDPMRQLASVQVIGSDSYEERQDLDEATDGWETEVTHGSETDTPTFNLIKIPVNIQYAEPKATQKLLEDSSINMENWLADKVAQRMARTEGAAFISGIGVGRPRGFLSYSTFANSATINYSTFFGKVEYIPSMSATAINASGIITQFYHLLEDYQARATWLMNRFTLLQVMLLSDTNGRPLWLPSTASMAERTPSTLLGAPVRMAANMPSIAANSFPIALADWSEAYLIVDRLGVSVLRDPYTNKPFIKFYHRRRVGGGVRNFQAINLMKCAVS